MRLSDLVEATITDRNSVLRKTPRKILTTARFKKELAQQRDYYSKVNFDDMWREFLRDKCWYDPPRTYGRKDEPLSAIKSVKGTQHAHIVKGECVVVYRIVTPRDPLTGLTDPEHSVLILYTIGEHIKVEKGGLVATGNLIRDMDHVNNWDVSGPPPVAPPPAEVDIPAAMLQIIINGFHELMNDDRDKRMLMDFAKHGKGVNDMSTLLQYLGIDTKKIDFQQLRQFAQAFVATPRDYATKYAD